MAYDPTSDRIVLFGGVTGPFLKEQPFDDTWVHDFDTNTWTELQAHMSPSARGWHAMAYAQVDAVIVLFSGVQRGTRLLLTRGLRLQGQHLEASELRCDGWVPRFESCKTIAQQRRRTSGRS